MDCSMPGFPVHHQLLELTQTQVHWVVNVIQLSHSLLSPPPPALNLSHHQSLFPRSQFFASGGQSIAASASAQSFLWIFGDWFPLGLAGWISLQFKGLSRVFSNTTDQKHQFFSSAFFIVQPSHPYMTTGKTITLTRWTFISKVMSLLFNMLSGWL